MRRRVTEVSVCVVDSYKDEVRRNSQGDVVIDRRVGAVAVRLGSASITAASSADRLQWIRIAARVAGLSARPVRFRSQFALVAAAVDKCAADYLGRM